MAHLNVSHLARICALGALSLPLTAQVTFQSLGHPFSNLRVNDMSSDGTAIVATSGLNAYLWTTTNPTFTLIPGSGGYGNYSVSNGGLYVCSTLPDPNNGNVDTAALWSAATGQWTFLGGLNAQSGTSYSSAHDISADGSVVVGLGWISANNAHAIRWDAVNGVVDLGTLQGSPSDSRADSISADGSTITGFDSDPSTGVWRGAKWVNLVESLTGCLDPNDPINGPSHGWAVSADGSYVVGDSSTGLYTPSYWSEMHAFRWDATNGLIDIGTTPVDPWGWGNHETHPTGVSADGRTIVGYSGVAAFGPGAVQPLFIWREGSGMSLLSDYLTALGVAEGSTWTLEDVAGISADGRVMFGTGLNASFVREPFMIVLPPLSETYCVAKVNSLGCTPAISSTGMASATSNLPFVVGASNVRNNKDGIVYYGFASMNAPWQGGVKCVAAPTWRTSLQNSNGSVAGDDCTGTYAYDFNALIKSGTNAQLTVGAKVFCQYWSRDPQSASTTGLTDGLSFTIFP